MSRHAERRSFEICPETCPAVDRAFDKWMGAHEELLSPALLDALESLVESFKDVGTEVLRAALTSVCGELLDAEDRIESLEHEIALARDEIDYLSKPEAA